VKDLAPEIHRQRLVIEGVPRSVISSDQIIDYLAALSGVLEMQALMVPVTHRSPQFGWAGWVHWETSGAHFYAWEVPQLFFSVDIYTCKPFRAETAVEFTKTRFDADVVQHHGF
jgi:hypothetical protein